MKQCNHCPEPVEAERYSMCKDCWWSRDPRNIKNGGTVDLDKLKNWKQVQPKESLIMIEKYDLEREAYYFTHVTPTDLANNPNNVNLELLGLHYINLLRHRHGLEPMIHDPKPDHRAIFTGDGKTK